MYARAVALLSIALALVCISCGDDSAEPAASSSLMPTDSPALPAIQEGLIAYAAADGTIWVINPDGSQARQLIAEPVGRKPISAEAAHYASWSPDGHWIAYLHLIDEGPPANGKLSSLNVLTGETRDIDDEVSSYQWIPGGGQWIPGAGGGAYVSYQRRGEVWMSDATGQAKRRLFDWAGDDYQPGLYAWSPDGRLLAYDDPTPSGGPDSVLKGYALFVMDADGVEPRHLADYAQISYFGSGAWSPDSRLLTYWKNEHGGSAIAGDVCVMNVVAAVDQCLGEFTSDQRPQWAPDQARHIFQNSEVDPDSGLVRELFPLSGAVLSWAPDSSRVAFVEGSAFGEGPRSLVVLEAGSGDRWAVDTNEANLAHAESPGYLGEWSPDGRYLAFGPIRSADGGSPLLVADAQTRTLSRLFEDGGGFVAYSPDSSRLLIQRGADSPSIWISRPDGSGPSKLVDGVALFGSGRLAPWRPADGSR